MLEKEIYQSIMQNQKKQKRQKTVSQPNTYLYLEDVKASGYVSYGGIIMQIKECKEERITEKEKQWFD